MRSEIELHVRIKIRRNCGRSNLTDASGGKHHKSRCAVKVCHASLLYSLNKCLNVFYKADSGIHCLDVWPVGLVSRLTVEPAFVDGSNLKYLFSLRHFISYISVYLFNCCTVDSWERQRVWHCMQTSVIFGFVIIYIGCSFPLWTTSCLLVSAAKLLFLPPPLHWNAK